MGRYGTNYPYRASWTFYGVGGNLAEDAVYPFAAKDGEGKTLDAASKYTLRFTKAEIPPVNAFWSLTMYDAESYLVPNSINRYALGDRSGMKFGDDGSLTIYIQNEDPGADKRRTGFRHRSRVSLGSHYVSMRQRRKSRTARGRRLQSSVHRRHKEAATDYPSP